MVSLRPHRHQYWPNLGTMQACTLSRSVVSNSLAPHALQPTRLPCHGILQARILEWVATSSSRGIFPDPGIKPESPALAGGFFTTELILYH